MELYWFLGIIVLPLFLISGLILYASLPHSKDYGFLQNIPVIGLNGSIVMTETLYNNGGVASFFSEECVDCVNAIRLLEKVRNADNSIYRNSKFSYVFVGDNIEKAKQLIEQSGIPEELVYLDMNANFFKSISGQIFPTTIYINSKGKIKSKQTSHTFASI